MQKMSNLNSSERKSPYIVRYFPTAPWSNALKIMSVLGCVLLIGVGIGAVNAVPHDTRIPYVELFGTVVAFVPPAIGLFAVLFIVSGYELKPHRLRIRRLLWSTEVSLGGLQRIYADSAIMKHSLKVCGNGGLFSITGIYRNHFLGNYRAFVTNPECAVALFLPDRVVVISPADPEAFVRAIRTQVPDIRIGIQRSFEEGG